LRCFMVAAQKEHILGISDFVSQEKAYNLNRLCSVVNIIAKKDVVCLRRIAAVFEESEQVVELSMNVTNELIILVQVAIYLRHYVVDIP
jgi:hypothetical protein